MAIGNLVPWARRDRDLAAQGSGPSWDRGELSPFVQLHQEMNRAFDNLFKDFGMSGQAMTNWPHLEVTETDDGYRVTAELAGMDEKDIDVSIDDGMLTIRGEKRAEHEGKNGSYSERFYGAFQRSLAVGDIDPEQVNASFDKGVLTITLPRSAQAQERVKRIPINAGTRH